MGRHLERGGRSAALQRLVEGRVGRDGVEALIGQQRRGKHRLAVEEVDRSKRHAIPKAADPDIFGGQGRESRVTLDEDRFRCTPQGQSQSDRADAAAEVADPANRRAGRRQQQRVGANAMAASGLPQEQPSIQETVFRERLQGPLPTMRPDGPQPLAACHAARLAATGHVVAQPLHGYLPGEDR